MADMLFRNLHVSPHWQGRQNVVSWDYVTPPTPQHNVVILSALAEGAWKNITDEGTLDIEGRSFIDTKPLSVRQSHSILYKVIVQDRGLRYDSPSVSVGSHLMPHEFAALRTILSRELWKMRAGNGVEVLLLKPLTYGEPADSFDPSTDRVVNPSTDTSGFGERYRGGYFPPTATMMQFVEQRDADTLDPNGLGVGAQTRVQARTFCFPRPAYRDLVVVPGTDDRYLVNQVQTHRFRGVTPLMCDAQLDLLPRGDVRYKLQVEAVAMPRPAPRPTQSPTSYSTPSSWTFDTGGANDLLPWEDTETWEDV